MARAALVSGDKEGCGEMTQQDKKQAAETTLMLMPDGRFDSVKAFNALFIAKEQITLFTYCKKWYGGELREAMASRYRGYLPGLGMSVENPFALEFCTTIADKEYADLERICRNTSIMCLYSAIDAINKAAVHIACQEDCNSVRTVVSQGKPKSPLPKENDGFLYFVDHSDIGYQTRFRILERALQLEEAVGISSYASDTGATWSYDFHRFRRIGEERRHIVHDDLLREPSIDVVSDIDYTSDYLLVIDRLLEGSFRRGGPAWRIPPFKTEQT